MAPRLARRWTDAAVRPHDLRPRAERGSVFFFFSNRLGCAGSILVSVVLTVILLLVLGVL